MAVLRNGRIPDLQETAAVWLPLLPDPAFAGRMRKKIAPGHFYVGLEWKSGQWAVEWARAQRLRLVWAQPLRWVESPQTYAVATAVFQHLPLQETMRGDYALDGLLPATAIGKRWGDAGREALANTVAIARQCGFDFSTLPAPPTPPDTALRRLIEKRLGQQAWSDAERARIHAEYAVIEKMGFAEYFLIAAAIGDFCRSRQIYFNLRGSGASSLILNLLGVSRIHPLKEGLLYERFVNSRRSDLPDIDIDIDSQRRPEVLQWVFKRYQGRVAYVSAHKFFGARSALYETARAAGLSPDEGHALTRNLPLFARPADLRERAKGPHAGLHRAAALLEGVFKELSLHPGGVVFSPDATKPFFPLERSPDGFPQVCWDKNAIERLNVFKIDLLGVRGFTVVAPVALHAAAHVDVADAQVWRTIREARTIGCFQIESPLSRDNLGGCQPTNLQELSICLAIIRPGPAKSGMKQAYQERRPPAHPLFVTLFAASRGMLIFEEQVSLLLHTVTGWDLEKAEIVRRALKKGGSEALQKEFRQCGRQKGWDDGDLSFFWETCRNFSLYAFCQAHSAAYAHSAYLSAWFKTHYPLAFFCRLLNAGGGYYPLPVYIDEVKRWGIRILPPDINRSQRGFSEEGRDMRCGLLFVKGIGPVCAARIIEQRGSGYATLEDFIARTAAGKREIAALLAASALASLGHDGFDAAEKQRNWQHALGFAPSA
jgi:DNA polymerase III alpha subunit